MLGDDVPDAGVVPDTATIQLLIALANITASCKGNTTRIAATTAAEKLVRAFNTVMAQKRQQFLHYRLQWLIFEHQQPALQIFSLPECFATPRGIHDVDVRQHWWNQLRGFPETLRKYQTKHLNTPLQGAVASIGANSIAGQSKSRTSRGELGRSISRARLQSETVATSAKQVARAVSRLSVTEGKPSSPMATPTRRWSLASLEKSEMQIPKPERVGMTTQELLERARKARDSRNRVAKDNKNGAVNPAELSEPVVFLSGRRYDDANLESDLLHVHDRRPSDLQDNDDGGRDNENDTSHVASTMRRASLCDIVINAAGGVEGSRLGVSCLAIPASSKMDAPTLSRRESQVSTRVPSASRRDSHVSSRVLSAQSKSDSAVRRGNRRDRPDKMYLERFQNLQAFEDTLRSETDRIRHDTARTMTGMQVEKPLPMARPNIAKNAASEWGVSSRRLALSLSRPVSAPSLRSRSVANLGVLQRQPLKAESVSTEVLTVEREDATPQTWGGIMERDCLPVPAGPVKVSAVASRQRSVDVRIDGHLNSRFLISRERDAFGEKIVKEISSASQKDASNNLHTTNTSHAVRGSTSVPSRSTPTFARVGDSEKKYSKLMRPATAPPCRSLTKPVAGQTIMESYLNKAAVMNSVPTIFRCLQEELPANGAGATEGSTNSKPLDLRFLNLSDKEAVTILTGLEKSKVGFDAVLLEGNSRLTDTSYTRLLSLLSAQGRTKCNQLQRLELTGAKGMREGSLKLLARELRAMKELREMSLEGIPISEQTWPALESGMEPLIKLQSLSLANTQVGRESQKSAVHVAEMLYGLIDLRSLDISGNFFGVKGCKALADCLGRHTNLASLDLSYNAGGFVRSTPSTSQKSVSQSSSLPLAVSRYNPISLVCEGVANARALKILMLANCQLNFDEDFALEVAMAEKLGVGLEELVLNGNSCQGLAGAQCLLRLVIQTPSLQKFDVDVIRHSLIPDASISYDFGDPVASYDVDFSHPQHRALLRAILRRCKRLGLELEKAIDFKNKLVGEQIIKMWREGDPWPDLGTVSFKHDFGNDTPNNQRDIVNWISSIGLKRKLKVSLFAFVRVADFFKNLIDDESRRVLISAMASDLLLKLSHVKCLSEMDGAMRMEIIEHLLPAVHQLDCMGGFDIFLSAREGARAVSPLHIDHKSTLNLLLFNAYCPSSHYELSLDVPADRRILEQLGIINDWDRARAVNEGFADLSQHGDHVALRNLIINGEATVWTQNSQAPSRGEMVFDYCSPWHPSRTSDATNDAIIDLIVARLTTSHVHHWLKLAILRTILHFFALLPEQIAQLMQCFPASGDDTNFSLRVEAFAILYARCINIGGLLAKLYSLELLDRQDVLSVRRRLGRLRTWDIMRCEQRQLIPASSAPEIQKSRNYVAELKLRDDVTSLGFANMYVLDLESTFEDWMCAVVLMQLAKKEGGESNFDGPSWSEKAHLEEKGSKWIIPQEWIVDQPPQKGILSVTYQVRPPNSTDDVEREMLALKYLGW